MNTLKINKQSKYKAYRTIATSLVALIYGLTFYTSCSKEKLENKPVSSTVVPTTLTDFQALLDNASILNNAIGLGEASTDNIYLTTTSYQELFNLQEINAYVWNKAIFEGETCFGWNSAYAQIFYANVVLEGIDKITTTATNRSQMDYVKGQALFFRAFAFFQLAELFAKPYNKSTINANDLGIPLRITADVNTKTERSTLQETYDKILVDLKEAAVLLAGKTTPPAPINKTRPSTLAIEALLARIYLSIGEYDNAFKQADSYLKVSSTLLNYNTLSTAVNFPFARFNAEVCFQSLLSNSYILHPNIALIDPTLYSQYDNNDLRKALFFKNVTGGVSFKGSYDGAGNPVFGGLATDEVYLIRAECYARLGKPNDALSDLNALLVNRYKAGSYVNYTGLNADEALTLILTERRKELVMRGSRWSDLRRLNLDPKFKVTLSRNVNGQTYTLPPNDPRYTFPIPDDVIFYNPGMPQNIR